jgi:hypothetical protein
MKKLFVFSLLFCIHSIYAETIFMREIQGAIINGGAIYIGIYYNEQSFGRENPDIKLHINSINAIIFHEIALPEEEYVIGIHQDSRGAGALRLWASRGSACGGVPVVLYQTGGRVATPRDHAMVEADILGPLQSVCREDGACLGRPVLVGGAGRGAA